MARAPNEKTTEALELYKKGFKLVEIAKELGLPDSTVRRWKKTYNWDNERSDKKVNVRNKNDTEKTKKVTTKKVESMKVNSDDESVKLTEKQRLFCIYYIENFNATKAYQRAYDCDYKTAKTNASRMLTNANVKIEIDRLTKECLQEQCISSKLLSKKVFEEYIKIAFSDITDYVSFGNAERLVDVDDEGNEIKANVNFVDFNSSDQVDGTLINEVKKGKDGVSIKLYDKMTALKWLSDRVDLLTDAEKHKFDIDKLKLDLEITKTELAILKQGGDEGEVEDDGFIEALNAQVEDVWDDEDY